MVRTVPLVLLALGVLLSAPSVVAKGPGPAAGAGARAEVVVPVGGRTTLTFPGLTRLRILDPALAEARVGTGGEVRLQGLAPGRTELHVWRPGGEERFVLVVR